MSLLHKAWSAADGMLCDASLLNDGEFRLLLYTEVLRVIPLPVDILVVWSLRNSEEMCILFLNTFRFRYIVRNLRWLKACEVHLHRANVYSIFSLGRAIRSEIEFCNLPRVLDSRFGF